MNSQYHCGQHCKYLVQYHLVFCPKFRFGILTDGHDDLLKGILVDVCAEYGISAKAMEVMPDHVHLFLDAPQTMAPSEIARILKSLSAKRMFAASSWLRSYYSRCKALWSKGYFISTVGTVSAATVKHYIEEQKNGNKGKTRKNRS